MGKRLGILLQGSLSRGGEGLPQFPREITKKKKTHDDHSQQAMRIQKRRAKKKVKMKVGRTIHEFTWGKLLFIGKKHPLRKGKEKRSKTIPAKEERSPYQGEKKGELIPMEESYPRVRETQRSNSKGRLKGMGDT